MFKMCVAVALAALSGAAQAGQVQSFFPGFRGGNGGEFGFTKLSGNPGRVGMAYDLTANSFETFCLERNEFVSNGQVYEFTVNDYATGGGQAGHDVFNVSYNTGFSTLTVNGDTLSNATKWLYYSFRIGTLAGYDYGAGRTASGQMLQSLVWELENEDPSNGAFDAGQTAQINTWRTAAQNAGAGAWSANVKVINIFRTSVDQSGQRSYEFGQSMLTLIPLPGAGALAMAGLGCVAIRRRRQA